MVMKSFHLTGFFLEKCSIMWWGTTVCESSLLLQDPNITKAFPEPRCLSVPSSGREQGGFYSRFAEWFSMVGICPGGLGTCAWPTEHLWSRKESCSCGSLGTVRKSIPSYSWVRKYWAWLCCTVGPAKPLILWELQHLWDLAKPSFPLSSVLRWLRDSLRQQLKYKHAEFLGFWTSLRIWPSSDNSWMFSCCIECELN